MTGPSTIWTEPEIEDLLEKTVLLPGDIAEIGVFKGSTLSRIIKCCKKLSIEKPIHAYDSFVGFAEPSDNVGMGYPKGRMNVGGVKAFVEIMKQRYKTDPKGYYIHEGLVPYCFKKTKIEFSLVFIDLDHYLPTLCSLAFVWPRLTLGGIVALHDYFKKQRTACATGATRDYFNGRHDCVATYVMQNKLLVKKDRTGKGSTP